jgi:hypothetical protein
MLTTVGYYSSKLAATALTGLTALADQTVRTQGSQLFVPATTNQVLYAMEAVNAFGGTEGPPQLVSPSLRSVTPPNIRGYVTYPMTDSYAPYTTWAPTPLPVVSAEPLEFLSTDGGDGSTPADVFGLVWLTDGKIVPATGPFRTVVAQIGNGLVAGVWNLQTFDLSDLLPYGDYDVIGMRLQGANAVACRLVFVGATNGYRPGVPVIHNPDQGDMPGFRTGEMGVLGSFNTTAGPAVEVLPFVTGSTTQYLYLDVVKH